VRALRAADKVAALPAPRVAGLLSAPTRANPIMAGSKIESFAVGKGGMFLEAGRAHGLTARGSFLSAVPIPNQRYVRNALSTLPEWNVANKVSDVFVPEGVFLQKSIAGPQGPFSGGGVQFEVLNKFDLDRLDFFNSRSLNP